MPTRSGTGGAFNPLGARGRTAAPSGPTDNDGWGDDAPQVTRSQLEKVAPAYKPTKVNMAELTGQKQEPSRFQPAQRENDGPSDIVRGGYQPIGKVDIAAIRRQAQEKGTSQDDRPTPVKGSYEPIGKVDIAAIRAKASGPGAAASPLPVAPQQSGDQDDSPKSLADRSAAFTQSERITSMPKPKVANRFGSNASTFTGTKAPTPGGFDSKPLATSAPIGAADKNFAAQGGKTPAQLWAEKKARERGMSGSGDAPSPSIGAAASPIAAQQSGGWQSGYSGKKWGDVATNRTGASGISAQKTGASNISAQQTGNEEPQEDFDPPTAGVSSIRDRFKDAAPMGAAHASSHDDDDFAAPPPPPMDLSSKPNAARGVPMPGLPQRAPVPEEEPEAPEDHPAEEHVSLPPPPPQAPRSPSPEPDEDFAPSSPARIAMPVARSAEPAPMSPAEEDEPPMPSRSLAAAAASHAAAEPEPQIEEEDPARVAAMNVASSGAAGGGKRAIVQYDYEKAEDNEIELREGEYVTDIEMVSQSLLLPHLCTNKAKIDPDWWTGMNAQGATGLFPSNYVELVEGEEANAGAASMPPPPPASHEPEPTSATGGKTATAQYDYEATEDNELSFPEGATIHDIVSSHSQSL